MLPLPPLFTDCQLVSLSWNSLKALKKNLRPHPRPRHQHFLSSPSDVSEKPVLRAQHRP